LERSVVECDKIWLGLVRDEGKIREHFAQQMSPSKETSPVGNGQVVIYIYNDVSAGISVSFLLLF
jgi:hypothetical protein